MTDSDIQVSRSVVLISLIVMCSLKLIVISPFPIYSMIYFIMYFMKSHKFVRNCLIFQKYFLIIVI